MAKTFSRSFFSKTQPQLRTAFEDSSKSSLLNVFNLNNKIKANPPCYD